MMRYMDAHVHLADDAFLQDIDDVLMRTEQSDVEAVVNVATTGVELQRALEYATRTKVQFYHVGGTPPQDAQHAQEDDIAAFEQAARQQQLVAIGEVGLDYHMTSDENEQEQQRKLFIRYCHMAHQYRLPLVVHCRSAFADFFRILDRHYHHDDPHHTGMLHCFTGTVEEAEELVRRRWLISISGIVTFKNAGTLLDVVRAVPLSSLLIETDAPFLTPVPLRGQRNEPKNVKYVAEKVAEIKSVSVDEVCAAVYTNMMRMITRSSAVSY